MSEIARATQCQRAVFGTVSRALQSETEQISRPQAASRARISEQRVSFIIRPFDEDD
jgi:hypothetical protein